MSLFIPDSYVSFPVIGGGCSASFTDDFTGVSPDWQEDGTRVTVDTTNDELDYDVTNTINDDAAAHDLTSISDSQWTLRFKNDIRTLTAGGITGMNLLIHISNLDETAAQNDAADAIGMRHVNSSFSKVYGLTWSDEEPKWQNPTNMAHTPAVEILYIEFNRFTATTIDMTIFSDATYDTVIENEVDTIPSTVDGMQYIVVQVWSPDSASGDLDGAIDDVEFYDGCNP